MTRWNRIKIDGVWHTYEYRSAWGKIYYSFDGFKTQATSKRQAWEIKTTPEFDRINHGPFEHPVSE